MDDGQLKMDNEEGETRRKSLDRINKIYRIGKGKLTRIHRHWRGRDAIR